MSLKYNPECLILPHLQLCTSTEAQKASCLDMQCTHDWSEPEVQKVKLVAALICEVSPPVVEQVELVEL